MNAATTVIRPIHAGDEAQWRPLWAQYLAFYRTPLGDEVTAATFRRLIAGGPAFALAAERDGALAGFAHCLFHASTWSVADYCYLEDLFVDPAARGTGAGRALIEAVYAEANRRGAPRVYWMTHEDNRTARRLYDKLATKSDFVQYRRT